MYLVFLVIMAFCFKAYKKRIPFASVVMATVSNVTVKYSGTLGSVFFGLIVQFAYLAFFCATAVACSIYFDFQGNSSGRRGTSINGILYALYVFLIFSSYWTAQVLQNVVHVTVSGVFAAYYFMSGSPQGMPANPTMGSFKRAVTTSFGSICYGSLLIALIQTVRALLRNAANNSDSGVAVFIACCVECLLAWIESLAEYFNRYAYVQVAIYGKPFCRAAKDTLTLIKDRGVDAIINDNLIGTVLVIGGFLVGLGSVFVAWMTQGFKTSVDAPMILVLFLSFIIGFVMFSVISSVVDSGVATTFVCLAEDPAALQATKPELWEKIRETYPSAAFTNMYS
jgi:uncharacterized integral membrane protein